MGKIIKDFKDKWVLITGAASGIGRALALEFTAAGSKIIIADIDEVGMQRTADELKAKGGQAICIRADMTRPDEVETLARRALEDAGQVDILINNAGIASVCEAKDLSREEWDRILATNLFGPIRLTHHLLSHMISRGSGHIVNVASMAGLIGIPGMVPYTVSKFGMVGFSESLRTELDCYGIRVTAVCPGVVKTPIIQTSAIKGFSEDLRNPPSPITMSVERAARIIFRGIRRNQARVIPATIPGKLLYLIKRIAPGLAESLIRKAYSTWERTPV
ncbi:MAG: SDR family NAD(P)-dependent oxidoreductase [Deltaproteobacteria bacterium]|nr:MAG: SDR family NAD(P)-dependent oxidoreductase [Deltaproteobacteria bacterium]